MISTFDKFLNGEGAGCDTDLPLRICQIERCGFIGFWFPLTPLYRRAGSQLLGFQLYGFMDCALFINYNLINGKNAYCPARYSLKF